MAQRDLVSMVSDVFNRRTPMHGQYMGSMMPEMTRFYFGANDPAAVYSIGTPRVPRGIMGQQPGLLAEQPPMPAPNPNDLRLAEGTKRAPGTMPYIPSPDAEIPPVPPAVPLPPERPASLGNDTTGFGSYGENVAPSATSAFDTKATGGKLAALGGGGSSKGQGESMYAALPSIVSAGMAGSGGGKDVDLTKYLRGMLRR